MKQQKNNKKYVIPSLVMVALACVGLMTIIRTICGDSIIMWVVQGTLFGITLVVMLSVAFREFIKRKN